MAILNNSVVLPVEYSREIIRGVLGRSKALELGRRLPDMRGKTYRLNVLSSLPLAGWVGLTNNVPNAKPLSDLAWEGVDLVAEEIAVIVPISINTLRDVENWVDIVPEISEQVVGAFQQIIDATAFFGVNSPFPTASLPSGGIVGAAATAQNTVTWDGQGGTSFYNAVNEAMLKVEEDGYLPNAILGGPSLNSAFRGSITNLGVVSANQGEIGALPRHIDLTGGFNESTAFAVVGDFNYLVYAFREEMEMRLLSEATLTDGTNTYNLAQQDMIAFRFTMRLGIAVPNPVNRVNDTAATRYPFATITKE